MILSIITVCFNSENTIENTIKSILSQSFSEFEWVVVDGDSNDHTKTIISEYLPAFDEKGIKVQFVSEKDKGAYDAMNKGALLARGEWLTYMNADDQYYSTEAIKDVAAFLKEGDADIVYGDTCFAKPSGRNVQQAKPIDTIGRHLPFCPQAAFVRTDVQRELMFDTKFKISADFDFFLRAFLLGKRFRQIDKTVAVFNWGGDLQQECA